MHPSGQWKINDSDFYIGGNGYVGIGTSTPQSPLDIKGTVNNESEISVLGNTLLESQTTIEGTLVYNHNAGQEKYLMAADDEGTAYWSDLPVKDAVVITGTAISGGNLNIPNNTDLYYSPNHYITLQPGRWLVKMTFLMRGASRSSNSQKLWIKLGIARRTNPSSSTNHEAYDAYRDRVNIASPVYVEALLNRKFSYTSVSGEIVIDTDTGGRFDLVVIKDELRPNGSFNWTSGDLQLSGDATENVLLAIRLY